MGKPETKMYYHFLVRVTIKTPADAVRLPCAWSWGILMLVGEIAGTRVSLPSATLISSLFPRGTCHRLPWVLYCDKMRNFELQCCRGGVTAVSRSALGTPTSRSGKYGVKSSGTCAPRRITRTKIKNHLRMGRGDQNHQNL